MSSPTRRSNIWGVQMFDFNVIQSCSLGDFYTTFSSQIWGWSQVEIFERVADFLLVVLTVWAGVYYMWSLLQVTTGKSLVWESLLTQTYSFVVASVFLAGWSGVFDVIDVLLLSGLWISGQVIGATTGAYISDMGSYVCTITTGFKSAFDQSFGFFADVSLFDGLTMIFFSLLFIVPWFLLWIKLIKSMAIPTMTVFAVLVLSGPTAVLFTVPWFRRTVMIDFKIIMAAALEMILVAAMFGVAVSFLDIAFDLLPLVGTSEGDLTASEDFDTWAGSDGYWMALFVFLIILWAYDAVLSTVKAKLEVTLTGSNSMLSQMWGSL
jgi:hypothetical protein